MRTCLVLRLDPVALSAGSLHGEIEEVATALHAHVEGIEDVVAFCRRCATGGGSTGTTETTGTTDAAAAAPATEGEQR